MNMFFEIVGTPVYVPEITRRAGSARRARLRISQIDPAEPNSARAFGRVRERLRQFEEPRCRVVDVADCALALRIRRRIARRSRHEDADAAQFLEPLCAE